MMERRLWAYHNAFGWFAVDPEERDFDENKVDEAPAVLEATTKHELACGRGVAQKVALYLLSATAKGKRIRCRAHHFASRLARGLPPLVLRTAIMDRVAWAGFRPAITRMQGRKPSR